jgi:hypothetical protein
VVVQDKRSSYDSPTMTQQNAGVYFLPVSGQYKIFVDFDETKFGFVRRLSHEMVHVKQMEDGRLKFLDDTTVSFDGHVCDYETYIENYHDDMPKFEEEAFDLEREISNAYWNRKNLNEGTFVEDFFKSNNYKNIMGEETSF